MEVIRYLDFFGTSCHFYIQGRPSYITIYGGFLSIISVILFIAIFLGFNLEEIERKYPITTTSSVPSAGYRIVKFGKEKIWIPWRLINYAQKIVNHTDVLFPVINYRYGYRDPKTDEINLKDKRLNYSLCNETSMRNIDRNIFSMNVSLDELYCIDMEDLDMGGGWTADFMMLIQFDLYICREGQEYNEDNPNCTTFANFQNITGTNDSWLFEFFYPVVQFQPNNLHTPVIIIYRKNFYHLSRYTNKIHRIYLKEHVLRDDVGWIISKDCNTSYWGLDSLTGDDYFTGGEDDIYNEGSNSRLYSLNIYLEIGITYFTRKYKKIFDIFSESLPIITILYTIFKNIIKIFKTTSTNKKLTELLFENLEQKKSKFYYSKEEFNKRIQKRINQKPKTYNSKKVNESDEIAMNNQNVPPQILCIKIEKKENKENKKNVSNINDLYLKSKSPKNKLPGGGIWGFNNKANDLPNMFLNKTSKGNKQIFDRKYILNKKELFPYRYYFFSTFIRNIKLSKDNKLFSNKYLKVHEYICNLFDVNTYFILHKQFLALKQAMSYDFRQFIESGAKVNINSKEFNQGQVEQYIQTKFNEEKFAQGKSDDQLNKVSLNLPFE